MREKIVTLCGSLKFIKEMYEIAERLSLEKHYVVIGVNPNVINRPLTDDEKQLLGELHKRKIDLADAIFVVNVDGYIGAAVKDEIHYAESLGKEILYLVSPADDERT